MALPFFYCSVGEGLDPPSTCFHRVSMEMWKIYRIYCRGVWNSQDHRWGKRIGPEANSRTPWRRGRRSKKQPRPQSYGLRSELLGFSHGLTSTTGEGNCYMNRSQQPYRLPSSVHGFSHGLTNSPPDCLLPSLRSGRPFESHSFHKKKPHPNGWGFFLWGG